MKTKKLTKTTVLLFSIAMLVSVIAFFCVPQITEAGIGMENTSGLSMVAATVLGVAVLVAAVMLRKDMSGGESWAAAIGRVAVLAAAYLVATLALSVMNGLLAVLLYAVLKSMLTLDQIKGIIDFTAMVLTLLAVPLFVSLFWMQMDGKRSLAEDLKWMLSKGLDCWLTVLIVMLVGMGIGWLTLTLFHYVPGGLLADIAKTLLFGAVGGTMLVLTRNACMKGVRSR